MAEAPEKYLDRSRSEKENFTRFAVNFSKEFDSLEKHAENIKRPHLSKIVNSIYMGKLQTKFSAPYFYSGEDDKTYHSLSKYQRHKAPPSDVDDTDVILGITTVNN